jgi:RimJ/RimL family protein N-acetyltransferase
MLKTSRLDLHDVERAHRAAFQKGRAALEQLLRLKLPDEWPAFPEAFSPHEAEPLANPPHVATPWPGYFFVDRVLRTVVGNGGFAGAPSPDGEIEIGYEVAPAYQRRGYATEAVAALIDHAFADDSIAAVIAHTLAEENASVYVLRKVGLRRVEEVRDAEVGAIWRWGITRAEWMSRPTGP